jgi:hypothetical protein
MVRRVIVGVITLCLALGNSGAVSALSCTAAQINADICREGGTSDGSGVDLWVDGQTPGGNSGGGTTQCQKIVNGRCEGTSPPKTVDLPESVRDVARFIPRPTTQSMEPAGWGIIGAPVNFVSAARTHIVAGTLLGRPAEVRFIPIRYRRDFGDGTAVATRERGSSWSSLGQVAWSETPTSHAYGGAGTFVVTHTVDYVADFRFSARSWTRLTGTVSGRANPLTVRIATASTVLVDRTCTTSTIGCGG